MQRGTDLSDANPEVLGVAVRGVVVPDVAQCVGAAAGGERRRAALLAALRPLRHVSDLDVGVLVFCRDEHLRVLLLRVSVHVTVLRRKDMR